MRTILFLTIDKEFTVCIENPKTLLNIKISILDLNKDFTCSTQKEITKPYSIKLSILTVLNTRYHNFYGLNFTDKRIDEGTKCFHI